MVTLFEQLVVVWMKVLKKSFRLSRLQARLD